MKLSHRALAGTLVLAALVAAGCPAPTTPGNTGNAGNTGNTGNNNTGNTGNRATPTPGSQATASPTASPAGANQEQEPNNDFDTAQELTLMQMLSGSFAVDDTDTYKVMIPAGKQDGVLKLTLNETDNDFSPFVTFYNSSKTELDTVHVTDGTTTPFVAMQNVTAGQMYYFKLQGSPSATVPYSVKGEFVPVADPNERNDSFETATALTSGQMVNFATFAGPGTNSGEDKDYFMVEVPANATQIKVMIDNMSTADAGQNFTVTLFGADKQEIDTGYGANDQADLEHTFNVSAAGTYYLVVTANNNTTTLSKLTATVQ